MRRIRLDLHQPTHDGDDTLYLLTTVPATAVDACTLARLYRERWTLENAFGGLGRASPIAQVPQACARTQEAAREADPRSPPTSCVRRSPAGAAPAGRLSRNPLKAQDHIQSHGPTDPKAGGGLELPTPVASEKVARFSGVSKAAGDSAMPAWPSVSSSSSLDRSDR